MNSNFHFLKKINNNLFDIIEDAEKLYRDEYFEQCMAQTRRFGEQICTEMLRENKCQTGSFDEMLATLKDKSHNYPHEKEFIDDLYFLKKQGNKSVHSSKVKQDAISALECLKRSFEIAINYCVYYKNESKDILKLNYDVELLITNRKSGISLKEKYEQAKKKESLKYNSLNHISDKSSSNSHHSFSKEKTQNFSHLSQGYVENFSKRKNSDKKNYILKKGQKQSNNFKIPIFWKIITFLSSISVLIVLVIFIMFLITK